MFRIRRVRIRWIGNNSAEVPLDRAMPRASRPVMDRSNESRVLTTLDLPHARVRVRWVGLATLKRPFIAAVVILILLIIYSEWTQPNNATTVDETFKPDQGVLADLIGDDINLGDQTVRLLHSPLDIGQAKDAFDNNLDTLMRGRNVNPFIMVFEFPQPQEIKGFVMDMGRMDFYLRVKVYAPGSTDFVLYEGEYRQQPPIPHVDLDFDRGPGQVQRIYIEIEQIDPPEEVHVHVREVVFKK